MADPIEITYKHDDLLVTFRSAEHVSGGNVLIVQRLTGPRAEENRIVVSSEQGRWLSEVLRSNCGGS